MALTTWTDDRLARLFARYRRKYWPTSRRLRRYSIRVAALDHYCGQCEYDTRTLLIDPAAHPSDRELRATVLHEMIHAVVGMGGHHAPFWTQLEYLLARGAPVTVSFPELGERGSHLCIIPARFRRCRRLFRPAYERRQRALARIPVEAVGALTPADLEQEAEDAAAGGGPWRGLWAYMARTYGFVDLDGRTLPFAQKYRAALRRGYQRGRRFYLQNERTRAFFEVLKGR